MFPVGCFVYAGAFVFASAMLVQLGWFSGTAETAGTSGTSEINSLFSLFSLLSLLTNLATQILAAANDCSQRFVVKPLSGFN